MRTLHVFIFSGNYFTLVFCQNSISLPRGLLVAYTRLFVFTIVELYLVLLHFGDALTAKRRLKIHPELIHYIRQI